MTRSVFTLACAAFAALVAIPEGAHAQQPLNLGFEEPAVNGSGLPWGWSLGWSAFGAVKAATFQRDSVSPREGRWSLHIAVPGSAPAGPSAILLQLPAAFARGKVVQLEGYTRTAAASQALLTLEAWKVGAYAAADTARAPSRSGSWQRVTLRITVPDDPGIHSIVIGAALAGAGDAWFDGLRLMVNGKPLDRLPLDPPAPSRAEIAALGRRAAAFAVSGPMDAFVSLADGASIIGLGESTHGTHEFFDTKVRLVRYLVETHGARLFAIEANQLAAERINRYVLTGEGTARDAMKVLFRVWNTEEVLALVEWMRSWNASHPTDPVQFGGFDMQDHRTPVDTMRSFLERMASSSLPWFDERTAEYRRQDRSATPSVPDSVRIRWALGAEEVFALMKGQRPAWLGEAASAADSLEVERVVQAANLYRQAAGFNVALNSPARDSLMAANVDWLVRNLGAGKPVVLWAHDVHVSAGGNAARSFNGGAQMGAFLRRWYGNGYRPLSFLTYDGAYTATMSFQDHRLVEALAFPAPANSLEGALHQLPRPRDAIGSVIDLRGTLTDPALKWLDVPRPVRHVGYAAYDYGFEQRVVLPLEFDGVVFIDHSSPSRMLK